ncbi:MAG: glycoside hydrolase family 88 protein [Opitutaceae bacterium]|jgi:unsaturated rhamnogalacturonyl hydrolase|nr:glycoside hydrolase family 88 protein [Opitutaceae bacterium]
MHTLSATRTLLARLAARTIARASASDTHPDLAINFSTWQWHQGVALFGLHRAHAALGDPAIAAFIDDWLRARLAAGDPPKSINTTAPLLTAAHLFEQTRDARLGRLCQSFADWCLRDAPRLPAGAFEHSCTDNVYPRQVWADTLFMGCIFLAKWGRLTGDTALLDEAARQFADHYRLLRDTATGLIFHGYDDGKHAHLGTLWGRGNGWFAIAANEVLSLLGPAHPAHPALLRDLRAHLAAAAAAQDASGAWHTVMDAPATYLEATSTAALACALTTATARGHIGAEFSDHTARALERTRSWINDTGDLTHASAGTPVMPDAASYNAIPFAVTPFSQGLGMLALASAMESPAP